VPRAARPIPALVGKPTGPPAAAARTPHELMRCAEVTLIRDCAEMAARASLVRAAGVATVT